MRSELMEVYLLRHGIAEDDSPSGRDSDRRLTDEGRQKLRSVLQAAAGAGVSPELIVSSPYVRARQTAEIAIQVLGYKEDLQFTQALVPESEPRDVWSEIRTIYRHVDSLLLASHEPLMSRCAGYLLGTPRLYVDFKKGAIMRIDIDNFGVEPYGALRWMLVPKLAGA
jgi:phosphohistidine phosphatase